MACLLGSSVKWGGNSHIQVEEVVYLQYLDLHDVIIVDGVGLRVGEVCFLVSNLKGCAAGDEVNPGLWSVLSGV